ncbi:hypothetical protein HPB47_020627 [Ixodes persulcatus]|uniref:Uncharacterized protein n=1 Tax=Ixodes persulcatus TaxID=34615 RepID=A0AC60QEW9_IXOPE|nr:hypothetical protein HPB47_020627 [Ixodes persulcatus]
MSRSVTLSDVATLVDGRKSSGIEHEQMRASRPPKFPCAVKLERDLRRNGRMCHTHRCCCTAARIAANDLGGCDPGATVAVPSTEKTPISTSELGELTVRRNAALGRHAASGYERRRKEQAHERGRKQMWKVFRGSAGSPCEFSSLLTRSWRRLPPACNVGTPAPRPTRKSNEKSSARVRKLEMPGRRGLYEIQTRKVLERDPTEAWHRHGPRPLFIRWVAAIGRQQTTEFPLWCRASSYSSPLR